MPAGSSDEPAVLDISESGAVVAAFDEPTNDQRHAE
jgi:hypothetical protein